MSSQPKPLAFFDSPNAPEIFADAASGTFWQNGVMHITLETLRVNHESHPGPVSRVVVGRLAMPLVAAEAMAKHILDAVEKSRIPAGSETQTVSRAH